MKNPKSILVIIDKPKHPQTALDRAVDLQKCCNAHLHLASFAWNVMADQNSVYDTHQRRALKKEILRARSQWLEETLRDRALLAADLTVETVWTADIARWVTERASNQDLVVKSVHKSQTLLHTPLDWQLIRSCPKPLLLVGADQEGGSKKKSRKKAGRDVLATLDLRNADRKHLMLNLKVLDAAARFAELQGGRVHCVAVVEYSEVLQDLDLVNPRKLQSNVVAATSEFLESLISRYDIPPSRVHRPAGKVGHLVNATARKIDAGLIVVGSAARRGIDVRLLGNSAEKILTRSPCDLLVIHP